MNPILVEATRGGIVESAHVGAIAVIDADGAVFASLGDIDKPIFPRSAVKVLQALPLVASGAADAFGLGDEELAIACASHNGEPEHTRVAAAMIAKAGLDPAALECGAHWPYREPVQRQMAKDGVEPTALHNNCSGKHAGFLCVACRLAGDGDRRSFARGYVGADHPVMREVTAAMQAATGFDLATTARGTDGCSIPTYAVPLRHLAQAFARIGTGAGLSNDHAVAAKRLRGAVAKHPFMVAGTGRFDTRVMEALGERVFCKVGAEGVFCASLPERGFGVAIKVDDGNNARAAEVAMAAAIEALLDLPAEAAVLLRGLSEVRLSNWNGIEVGSLRAAAALRRLVD